MDWQFKVGIGVTVVVGILPFAVKDMPHWMTWAGIAIGVAFVLWGVVPGHDRIAIFPGFLFVVLLAATSAAGSWCFDLITQHADENAMEGSIFVEAHNMQFLPQVYPSEGKVEVVFLDPHVVAAGAQSDLSVMTLNGIPGTKIEWPKSADSSIFAGAPVGSLYEITNDTPSPLKELIIPLRISYGAEPNNRLIDKTLTTIRLDPGRANHRAIYVFNRTPDGGAITLPTYQATASRVGDGVRRQVQIAAPSNPILQSVLFVPFDAPKEVVTKKKPNAANPK